MGITFRMMHDYQVLIVVLCTETLQKDTITLLFRGECVSFYCFGAKLHTHFVLQCLNLENLQITGLLELQ